MPLYNVYVWEVEDADAHEWIVDITDEKASELAKQLDDLFFSQRQGNGAPTFSDYGVHALTPEKLSDVDEYLAELKEIIDDD